jgi:hypothetical protein
VLNSGSDSALLPLVGAPVIAKTGLAVEPSSFSPFLSEVLSLQLTANFFWPLPELEFCGDYHS